MNDLFTYCVFVPLDFSLPMSSIQFELIKKKSVIIDMANLLHLTY